MSKHTPEPWKIGALESGQAAVDGADGSEVTGFVSIPDAHLIAAAPDMLAALEAILPMLPQSLTTATWGDPSWTDAIRRVESAIKKARGAP
jgi:hypothetical protein